MSGSSPILAVLTRRDLVRSIGRADELVAADVRHRLEIYGGPGRFTVTVPSVQASTGARR